MKLSTFVAAAFAAVAWAKPAFTNTEFNVQEGKPITLTWTGASGPVTLELVSGPDSKSLTTFQPITTVSSGTSFTYIPTGIPSGNYAFRITDSTNDPNYSVLFAYSGTGPTSTSGSSTSSGMTTKSSSSSSSTSAVSSSITSSASTSASTSSTASRSTSTTASTTRAAPSSTPTNNNEGQRFSSPLAMILITVAALVFFN